jgi:hypothetical protein
MGTGRAPERRTGGCGGSHGCGRRPEDNIAAAARSSGRYVTDPNVGIGETKQRGIMETENGKRLVNCRYKCGHRVEEANVKTEKRNEGKRHCEN